ncbi:MAG: flagellar export chaperone FliS [Candidatus Gastranaerophilales bacterium]|nr:flagellar export chaperone FliS [Candidatus Gastranaerophilales bacterium]
MNQYIKQYKKSSIETASKEQILIMLYDGAIQFLNKAKIAINNREIENAHNNLIAAQNILQEFIDSMDREVAPQLAENLISLYEYFIRRLIQANIKKQIEPIDEVLKYLKSLKATWEQAIVLAQKEEAQKLTASKRVDFYDTVSTVDYSDDDSDEDDDEDGYA